MSLKPYKSNDLDKINLYIIKQGGKDMITYKGDSFFLVPRGITNKDMEFNIYNSRGRLIGTNFTGVLNSTYYSKKEIMEIEEIIENYTFDLEIKIKFFEEYNIEIKKWKSINYSKKEIIDNMTKKWNLPSNVMKEYLIS